MNFDLTLFHLLEKYKPKKEVKKTKKRSKLDFSKDDVNSDGKVDKTDSYLNKRNEAMKKAMSSKNGKEKGSSK